MRRSVWVLVLTGVVITACSPAGVGGDTTTATGFPSTVVITDSTTTVTPATTTVTSANPKTSTTTTTPPPATTTTDIPGGLIEFGPRTGEILMVIGVAHDDVLNLREDPSATSRILATIEPTWDRLVATGSTWERPGAFWIGVEYGNVAGWVNLRYVGYMGETDDIASAVVELHGGIPVAPTMRELGLVAARALAYDDPIDGSEIVLVVDETVGDLGEVTYDVIGLGDDSTRGLRLHVFGQPVADGFSLVAVESTEICARGVTEEGLCT